MRYLKMDVCQKLSVENTTLRFTEHESVFFFNFMSFFCISLYNNITLLCRKKIKGCYWKNQLHFQNFFGENNSNYEEKIIFKEQ